MKREAFEPHKNHMFNTMFHDYITFEALMHLGGEVINTLKNEFLKVTRYKKLIFDAKKTFCFAQIR